MLPTVKPCPTHLLDKLTVFQDPSFTFDPVPHKYTLDGQELTSATTWLKQFCAPFERERIAAEREAATGRPAQEFLDEWDRAAWIGTKTHEFIENFWQGSATPDMATCDPEVSVRCDKFLRIYRTRLYRLTPVAQELRVFHRPTRLCGTIDFLAQTPDNELAILDWKTNKRMDTDADRIWRYMRGRFMPYGDNEHNKYSLQISLYRVILEEAGIKTNGGGFIVWIPTGSAEPRILKALDFRDQVRQEMAQLIEL